MSVIKGATRSIAIVGFMGVGKTTIGKGLAQRLQLPFCDTDRELEAAFDLSVSEIFAQLGEQEFRSAERELVARLLAGPTMILSLGGGAYVDVRTRSVVNQVATAVWLDPPFELILARLSRSRTRPLASGKSPEDLRQMWNERRPSYAEAHIHLQTSDGKPADAVEQLLKALS